MTSEYKNKAKNLSSELFFCRLNIFVLFIISTSENTIRDIVLRKHSHLKKSSKNKGGPIKREKTNYPFKGVTQETHRQGTKKKNKSTSHFNVIHYKNP